VTAVPPSRVHQAITALLNLDSNDRARWLEQQFPDDPGLRSRLMQAVGDSPHTDSAHLRFSVDGENGPALIETIGRYEVVQRLGSGGMGEVYLALDPTIGRYVAIKLLRRGVETAELRQRFLREARAAGQLDHPNIVTIFDVQDDDGRLFLAMEYIRGRTIADIIEQKDPLSLVRKLEILEAVCSGLAHAHAAGIIHRDIKPANLMVEDDGGTKILDFGIAKAVAPSVASTQLTSQHMVVGTVGYISPEHLSGGAITPRSDMFAAAVVAYELLTNTKPFGSAPHEISRRTLLGDIRPMSTTGIAVPETVERIVLRALAPSPEDRYRDLATLQREFAAARSRLATHTQYSPIESASGSLSILAAPPQYVAENEVQKDGRRVPFAFAVGALTAAVAAAALVWVAYRGGDQQMPTSTGSPSLVQRGVDTSAPPVDADPSTEFVEPRNPAIRQRLQPVTPLADSRPGSASLERTPETTAPVERALASDALPREDLPSDSSADPGLAEARPVYDPPAAFELPDAGDEPIRVLLQQYQQAYLRKSAAALKAIYPGLGDSQLAALDRTFLETESYVVEFGTPQITIRDDRAVVAVTTRERIMPTSGQSRVITSQAVISLERSGGMWTISSIRRR
jgi:serine/threonine protein kinase